VSSRYPELHSETLSYKKKKKKGRKKRKEKEGETSALLNS
jgi:hypothetical protein